MKSITVCAVCTCVLYCIRINPNSIHEHECVYIVIHNNIIELYFRMNSNFEYNSQCDKPQFAQTPPSSGKPIICYIHMYCTYIYVMHSCICHKNRHNFREYFPIKYEKNIALSVLGKISFIFDFSKYI